MTEIWGLFEYKPQWTLTIKGWLILLSLLAILISLIFFNMRSFLAHCNPVKAEILVLEGWVRDEVIKGAINEFSLGDYKLLITTGIELERGFYLAQYKNNAELAAATLIALDFPKEQLVAVPAPKVKVNRTVASAKALNDWLEKNRPEVKAINIYSYDVHTRRSKRVFAKVLPREMEIGAIAHPSSDYDIKHWWNSSTGFRTVTGEIIAYIYSVLINRKDYRDAI